MSPNTTAVNGSAGIANGHVDSHTRNLITWASRLSYDDLPHPVIERTKDFFMDWLACTIAGRHHPAVTAIQAFVKQMGPSTGKSEVLHSPSHATSPAFAALVNGASSHVVEQDDLHNNSIVHPATVIFPAALAVAQDIGADGKAFLTACVVGYDVACRTGEYLGKTHYQKFHMTATAGVIGVAAAAAHLLHLSIDETLSAIGTAGTQAAGLWQFLLDATHSKQVHTGKACFDGIFAAYVAKAGLLGPMDVLEGSAGMGATLSTSPNPSALDEKLGTKYSILESSFKWHASCRHTHPSADALLLLMDRHNIQIDDIDSVLSETYQSAIDVLSRSEKAQTVHQSKFSMGFVLAVVAKNRRATVADFNEDALKDPVLREFQQRVTMVLNPEIDAAFPKVWKGLVKVRTKSGENYCEAVDVVKGDPGNTLSRAEIEAKAVVLGQYGKIKEPMALKKMIQRVWDIEHEQDLNGFAIA